GELVERRWVNQINDPLARPRPLWFAATRPFTPLTPRRCVVHCLDVGPLLVWLEEAGLTGFWSIHFCSTRTRSTMMSSRVRDIDSSSLSTHSKSLVNAKRVPWITRRLCDSPTSVSKPSRTVSGTFMISSDIAHHSLVYRNCPAANPAVAGISFH